MLYHTRLGLHRWIPPLGGQRRGFPAEAGTPTCAISSRVQCSRADGGEARGYTASEPKHILFLTGWTFEMKRCVAHLPLHTGKAPPWLFKRMTRPAA